MGQLKRERMSKNMKLGGGNGVEMLGLLWLKWRCRYDHISLNTHMKLTKNKKCISIAFFS